MQIGGVTPLGCDSRLPIWVDAAVMAREEIILGGGDRASKVIISPRVFARMPSAEVVEGLARPREEGTQ